MKQYEKIKNEIIECKSAMEMAGYLHGINTAAIVYCKQNYPSEVYVNGGESDVSIYGLSYYLESDV